MIGYTIKINTDGSRARMRQHFSLVGVSTHSIFYMGTFPRVLLPQLGGCAGMGMEGICYPCTLFASFCKRGWVR